MVGLTREDELNVPLLKKDEHCNRDDTFKSTVQFNADTAPGLGDDNPVGQGRQSSEEIPNGLGLNDVTLHNRGEVEFSGQNEPGGQGKKVLRSGQ